MVFTKSIEMLQLLSSIRNHFWCLLNSLTHKDEQTVANINKCHWKDAPQSIWSKNTNKNTNRLNSQFQTHQIFSILFNCRKTSNEWSDWLTKIDRHFDRFECGYFWCGRWIDETEIKSPVLNLWMVQINEKNGNRCRISTLIHTDNQIKLIQSTDRHIHTQTINQICWIANFANKKNKENCWCVCNSLLNVINSVSVSSSISVNVCWKLFISIYQICVALIDSSLLFFLMRNIWSKGRII